MLSILLLAMCVAIAIYLFLSREKNDPRLPPGPKGLPYLGNLTSLLNTHLHFTLAKWSKEYGDIFTFTGPGRRAVVISCPDMIRETMTKPYDVAMQSRPPTFCGEYLFEEFGDVIFTPSEEPNYVPRRKALHRLIKLYGENGHDNEGRIIKEMQAAMDRFEQTDGKPFEPHDIVAKTIWDIIGGLVCMLNV
jgi:cytochrome P450